MRDNHPLTTLDEELFELSCGFRNPKQIVRPSLTVENYASPIKENQTKPVAQLQFLRIQLHSKEKKYYDETSRFDIELESLGKSCFDREVNG